MNEPCLLQSFLLRAFERNFPRSMVELTDSNFGIWVDWKAVTFEDVGTSKHRLLVGNVMAVFCNYFPCAKDEDGAILFQHLPQGFPILLSPIKHPHRLVKADQLGFVLERNGEATWKWSPITCWGTASLFEQLG